MQLCGLIFNLLLTFCADILWLSGAGGSDTPSSPPAPELVQVHVGGTMVLQCRAPQGHRGRQFKLFRVQELVDTVKFDTEETQAEFTLTGGTMEPENHFCCQYDNSMISPYTTIRKSPSPLMPPPPPHLTVSPPGHVSPGQVVDFHCQGPPTSPGHPPMTFLLQVRQWGAESYQEVDRSSNPHFRLQLVRAGSYTCLYQFSLAGVVQNSPSSSPVKITVPLPAPHLSLDDEGILLCTGLPSYPGAHFSLYHQGTEVPTATHHAPMVQHSARFSVQGKGGYQCQYSVLLGKDWAHSERSTTLTLPCTTGSPYCSSYPTGDTPRSTAGGRVDLALIIGSVSASLLFLLVLIFLGFSVHKHAKAAAEKRRKREQDAFWQQLHSRDHIVDLSLQSININPTDCFGVESGRESVSEPIYDYPFSTFTPPPPRPQ